MRVPVNCPQCGWRGRRVPDWKRELNKQPPVTCPTCRHYRVTYPQPEYRPAEVPADLPMPDGCSVLTAAANRFVGRSPGGKRSPQFTKLRQAYGWVVQHAFLESGNYPGPGQVWRSGDRRVVICGNFVSSHGTLWAMDWETGARSDPLAMTLAEVSERHSIPEDALVERFSQWARAGNATAIWWLAWWFEGVNHPKSVWYYVAAMRLDPESHGWVHNRLMSDAQTAAMCEGVPKPDLGFLATVPEIQGYAIGKDWRAALRNAEAAVHVPAAARRARRPRPSSIACDQGV